MESALPDRGVAAPLVVWYHYWAGRFAAPRSPRRGKRFVPLFRPFLCNLPFFAIVPILKALFLCGLA